MGEKYKFLTFMHELMPNNQDLARMGIGIICDSFEFAAHYGKHGSHRSFLL